MIKRGGIWLRRSHFAECEMKYEKFITIILTFHLMKTLYRQIKGKFNQLISITAPEENVRFPAD